MCCHFDVGRIAFLRILTTPDILNVFVDSLFSIIRIVLHGLSNDGLSEN